MTLQCVRAAMSDFVFSIDVEMGVGIEHFKSAERPDPELERKTIPKIISLCKDYGIKPTFAVCGHLFLDGCKGHDELPKPTPSYYEGDWYKKDPKSKFPENTSWYAPDLIEKIKPQPQSHPLFLSQKLYRFL